MTKRATTIPTLFAACALALVAVGCGVDAKIDSSGATTPTAVEVPDTATSETVTVPERPTTTEADEPTTVPDEPTTTSRPTGTTLPAGLEDTFRDSLEQGFKNAGLDDTQAKCLADGYLDKFGTDVSSSTDQAKMLGLFTECGINPSDFGGAGG